MEDFLMHMADGYKLVHRMQYPEKIEYVYTNWTPRSSRNGDTHMVWWGVQSFVDKWFVKAFRAFLDTPRELVVARYEQMLTDYLGPDNGIGSDHIGALHDLGYLPLEIRALPEGTVVPIGVPVLTIVNTHPDFFWLPNYFETLLSSELWLMSTSATTAWKYRKLFNHYAELTGAPMEMVQFQGHDFSMRGMQGVDAAARSGASHLLSFAGTDTIPALGFIREYYAGYENGYLVGTSVPACYDPETEILTENGFVKFPLLQKGVRVAQYNQDGTIDFVEPTAYYEDKYKGPLIHHTGGRQGNLFDLMVTPNHKMVVKTQNNELELRRADENPFRGKDKVIVSGTAVGEDLDQLSDIDRLEIAFQADGSYASNSHRYSGAKKEGRRPIRFTLKKTSKKERLKAILDRLGYEYSITDQKRTGYVHFWIQTPETLSKTFDWIPYQRITANWAKEFIEEVSYWDASRYNDWDNGTTGSIQYFSSIKENTDAVATVAILAGYRSHQSFYVDQRSNRKDQHIVSITKKTEVGAREHATTASIDFDGIVYCVSVPSKMLVVRRNDIISVCGNTEHSVMCAGGEENEMETFERLLRIHPSGILSVVSDTWDLWNVLTEILPALKEKIMARPGALIIRPDCYDEETSIRTPSGWKKFADLTEDDLVAQVLEDGSYEFVKPLKNISMDYNGLMVHFKDQKDKCDLLVTPNHRMLWQRRRGNVVIEAGASYVGSNESKMYRSAQAKSGSRKLTPFERLQIAFQADGSYESHVDINNPPSENYSATCRFNFAKKRKADRLIEICEDGGFQYSVSREPARPENYNIYVKAPAGNLPFKNFDWVDTSDLEHEWCVEFIEELANWDATKRSSDRYKFDTTNESVIRVVELIAIGAGFGVLISQTSDDRSDKFSDVFTAHIMKDNRLGGQAIDKEYEWYEGKIYCVTVPSGMLLVKRNRATAVCGNSGDPVKIMCGDPDADPDSPQFKGVIELLWDVFGGTINEKGFKVLDSHVGAIYGDSITLERATAILDGFVKKGFVSSSSVFGIGSFTYTYVTRDTYGFAMKATWVKIDGVGQAIFKDPVTDDGGKTSARGLLAVRRNETTGELELHQDQNENGMRYSMLRLLWKNGNYETRESFKRIRERLAVQA